MATPIQSPEHRNRAPAATVQSRLAAYASPSNREPSILSAVETAARLAW